MIPHNIEHPEINLPRIVTAVTHTSETDMEIILDRLCSAK
jgi:hypothetical protein